LELWCGKLKKTENMRVKPPLTLSGAKNKKVLSAFWNYGAGNRKKT
jgi:hypothetical protein